MERERERERREREREKERKRKREGGRREEELAPLKKNKNTI